MSSKTFQLLNANILAKKSSRQGILFGILLASSVLFAAAISFFGLLSVFLILIGILVLPVVYAIIAYPKIGIYTLLTLAYILMFFTKFGGNFPVGTLMDGIEGLLLIGFLLKQRKANDWKVFNNSISAIILVWVLYNLIEVINPSAASKLAWVYTIRTVAIVTLTYFIFLYYMRDVQFIRSILKLWIFLTLIGALYAFKQEHFGFSGFELTWLNSDPKYTSLYFIGNHWRKFSIFTDPVTFAYNMVISTILCFSLLTSTVSRRKKALLVLLGCFFFINMLYSGTRGAYVIFPVVFVLFSVLRYNPKLMAGGVIAVCVGIVLILMPTTNYTLYRFQTAFKPANDASYNLRKANQSRIQPFILSHPLGGGLGATGVWGKRFSPDSELANFPPDSGYVRVAVELGWLGLFLFCTLMFIILKTGVKNYFMIKDPELKSYCLAMVMIIFALNIGNYPQEALVQYPINIYFYMAVALINATLILDKRKSETIHTETEKTEVTRALL